jgi:hypothetical protein
MKKSVSIVLMVALICMGGVSSAFAESLGSVRSDSNEQPDESHGWGRAYSVEPDEGHGSGRAYSVVPVESLVMRVL